jgi:hypothetical protein
MPSRVSATRHRQAVSRHSGTVDPGWLRVQDVCRTKLDVDEIRESPEVSILDPMQGRADEDKG